MAAQRICVIPNCGKPHYGRGWCKPHYMLWRRHGDPLINLHPKRERYEALKFFEEVVLRYDGDECLIWPFSLSSGYGRLWFDGDQRRVHRLVCERVHGDPPTPEHEAAHGCGVPACVNWRHIRWDTHQGNHLDRFLHGTHWLGERNAQAKLTAADVIQIRSIGRTRSQDETAKMFGVSQSRISSILSGNTWGWLHEDQGETAGVVD